MNRPFMVSQQRQTSIVPEIPPDDREDKQQHLEVTEGITFIL